MKKFLIKSACLLAVIFAIMSAMAVFTVKYIPVNTDNYNYEHVIKMHRLDTLTSPRLIFIGGSNIAFGIDSRRISDSLHINVQNAAVHAGIGLRYMLDQVNRRLRPGDIVAVMPEYSQFDRMFNGDDEGTLSDVVIYGEGDGWEDLNYQQRLNVVLGFPAHLKGRRRIDLDRAMKKNGYIYATRNFNEYGDEAAHRVQKPKPIDKKVIKAEANPENIREIAYKIRDMESKGARVILLWPTTIQSNYEANMPLLSDVTNTLGQYDIRFASQPDYLVQPDSLAYDTPYHMSGPAVEIVTDKIILLFKKLGMAKTLNP